MISDLELQKLKARTSKLAPVNSNKLFVPVHRNQLLSLIEEVMTCRKATSAN